MKVTFYLDKPDAKRSVVMVNVALKGQRIRLGTGISIDTADWNTKRQEPKPSDPHINANRKKLEAIRAYVNQAYNDLTFTDNDQLKHDGDIQNLKVRIQSFLTFNESHRKGSPSFQQGFTEFIENYTLHTRTGMVTAQRPAPCTIELYKRTRDTIIDFSKATRYPLTYESIDQTFYQKFFAYQSQEKGLVDASISNFIKILKTYMKWSKQKGYHATQAYESFYRDKRNADTLALTVDELRLIRDVDLSSNPKLMRVRDHFLLQSYTGMRYGDLIKLVPRHFDDAAGVIRLVTEKTGTVSIIPITKPLKLLLERFPSRVFEFTSDVKQNLYLKELGRLVGWTQPTPIARFRAGKRDEEIKPKCDLITTHVARRTYVTTSLRLGVPESVISVVTGHSAKGMLQQHYIRFDEQALCELVCQAWEKL